MVEGNSIEAEPTQRFVIERPRLMRLLDNSRARLAVLAAPAGYGKTTLARTWLAQDGRRSIWLRADNAYADVAALAADVAVGVETIVPDCSRPMLARLAAATKPDDDGALLGKILASSLHEWPRDAWLAIDDYQYLGARTGANAFVESLTTHAPIQLLVTSRTRPSWASARRVLYDEVLVIGKDLLAFTRREALEVLESVPPRVANAVIDRARGWPAVVRLAALSGRRAAPVVVEDSALYQYFAEELYNAAPTEVSEALLRLTPYPTLTEEVVTKVLGDTAAQVCDEAASLGFLSRYDRESFELHPLLREFLEMKFARLYNASDLVQRAFGEMLEEKRWDDAHTIIARFQRSDLYDPLLDASIATMVGRNRVATLSGWTADALQAGWVSPLVEVARSEVEFRSGNLDRAVTQALHATHNLAGDSQHLSRAFAVASEGAHLLMRPSDAIAYGELSIASARTAADERRAVWSQLLSNIDFELEDPRLVLSRFRAVADGSIESTLRVLIAETMIAVLDGSISSGFDKAKSHLSLAEHCGDVLASTSFEYRVGYLGMLAGRYPEALPIAWAASKEIEAAGLGFAVAPARGCLAGLMIGLRRLRRAERLVDSLADELRKRPNRFAESNWYALHARMLLTTGSRELAAREAHAAAEKAPMKSMQAEGAGLHALATAAGESATPVLALKSAEEAMTISREAQGITLGALARAVVALNHSPADVDDALDRAAQVVQERQNYDSLVYAIRAYPPLLQSLRERQLLPDSSLATILTASHDTQLAASVGWPIQRPTEPQPLLTPREREVFGLVRQGCTNREIANALYISEATVKVHMRHILEKVGARSRTEAVVRFARYRLRA